MRKQVFRSPRYPTPVGPYSQAVRSGDLLFVSGTGPLDPRTGKVVEGGIREQVRQVLTNMKNLLEDAGSSLDNVLKVTVFLADMSHYSEMNEEYRSFFQVGPPARTCVQAARLPGGFLVEIEAIALLPTE